MEYTSVAIMNKKYGEPGRIVFRNGPGGFPVAVLVAPAASCEISLYGAHVLSYRPLGHQQVLYTSPTAVYEEGRAIRGGIPICWPWFGPAPSEMPQGTPSHGFARKSNWVLLKTEFTKDATMLELGLADDVVTDPAFPHAYLLKAVFTLGECLSVELHTRNMGDKTFTYSECLHAYLAVSDANQCEVFGLDGVEYIDLLDPTLHTQEGSLTVDQPYDRTYHATNPEEGGSGVALNDPLMGRSISIVAEDASGLVVWRPRPDYATDDLPEGADKHFICVEPANPHHPTFTPITLPPGESHITTLRIQPQLIK